MQAVEVTDLESEKQIATLARNLSLFGCFVATITPFVTGTKVRVRITHRGATFAALGWVAHILASEGMGITFGGIERDRAILLEFGKASSRPSSAGRGRA
jgi:hypothetical protein